MTTPESRVKTKITKVLRERENLWYYMPVPGGYGRSTVDYLCCYRSTFFVIEAKRPDKGPTERQAGELEDVVNAGGVGFVINDDDGVRGLSDWLDTLEQ